ncbi:MAG TPA: hypothetical protein VFA55_06445 [Candidatus Kapabacteria bacterium]|nr:hypothetical protein [Candidatus Kapabacteria bacterium]
MMNRIIYGVLISLFIFSGTEARPKHNAEDKGPVTDILYNNDLVHISTFDSTYIQNKDIPRIRGEMHFVLTEAEQQRIAELADSVGFWKLPAYLVGDRNVMPNPGTQTMRIKTARMDWQVMWAGVLLDAKTAAPIDRIKAVLDSIAQSRPEYKKLPSLFDRGYDQFMPPPKSSPIPLSPR